MKIYVLNILPKKKKFYTQEISHGREREKERK